ncbi:cell wall hydrolase [Kordiimonas aquimaris]|uniref:cell wall hydrolase n=1 Tax=Kordiimonas aquimaris TaxID=707591 RepID=UPI0021CFD00C|nr:cell wall hydrolase [Kordiimonas aquimaris]
MTKIKLIAIGLLLAALIGTWLYWQHNIEWAARVAWGEARGEPDGGMQAVLNVMANRKRDPRFPNSLASVARQPFQFSAYNTDDPNKNKLEAVEETDPEFRHAVRLATFAQLGLLWDITDGATYFHHDKIEPPTYLSDAEVTMVIGSHVFYKNVSVEN